MGERGLPAGFNLYLNGVEIASDIPDLEIPKISDSPKRAGFEATVTFNATWKGTGPRWRMKNRAYDLQTGRKTRKCFIPFGCL